MTPERKRQRIDFTLKWGDVSIYAATFELIEALARSRRLAQELEDMHRLANVIFRTGQMYYVWVRMSEAITEFEHCAKLAQELRDDELVAHSRLFVGRCLFYPGEFEKGSQYLKDSIPAMQRMGKITEGAYGNFMLALTFGWTGKFEESLHHFDFALETAGTADDPSLKSATLWMRSVVWALRGEWDYALADANQSAQLAAEIGNTFIAAYATSAKGFYLFMSGDPEAGKTLMLAGLSRATEGGSQGMPIIIAWHAEAMAMRVPMADARAIIANASDSAERNGLYVGRPTLDRARAIVAARETPPDWDKVDAHMQAAIQFTLERGARPDLAITHYRYAELLAKKGDLDQAREQLDQAIDLFREMEMTWWLEQAERLATR